MRYIDLFNKALIKSPEDAKPIQILMQHAFRLSNTQFWIDRNSEIKDSKGCQQFKRYLRRLLNHEPLAYILREKEFFSKRFYVNRKVLIPRPETEILVEKALQLIKEPIKILDIGAGSGNICIVIAEKTGSQVIAVEKDPDALKVLKKNILLHGQEKRIKTLLGDLFPGRSHSFDMIVCNPPYLSEREWENLPEGIKNFEPREALVSGPKGTECIERIIKQASGYLSTHGSLLIEMGFWQHSLVERFLEEENYHDIEFVQDYNGILRVAVSRR